MKIEDIGSKYSIDICAFAHQKLTYLLSTKYSKEFTAFLHCERKGNVFFLSDPFFPIQENSSVKTDVDSDDLIKLIEDGADISKLSGHMHSHVNMDVKPSVTDETEIVERSLSGLFSASIIMNKKGDIYGHIADQEIGFFLKDVPVFIRYPYSNTEFEDGIMVLSKEANNYEELMEVVMMSESDFFDLLYPLKDADKKALDDIVKNRFIDAFRPLPMPKKGSWNTGNTAYGRSYPRYGGYVSPGYGVDWDEHDTKKMVEVPQQKGINEMTDEEYYEFIRTGKWSI